MKRLTLIELLIIIATVAIIFSVVFGYFAQKKELEEKRTRWMEYCVGKQNRNPVECEMEWDRTEAAIRAANAAEYRNFIRE